MPLTNFVFLSFMLCVLEDPYSHAFLVLPHLYCVLWHVLFCGVQISYTFKYFVLFDILCAREKPKDRPYLFSGEFAADTSWVLGEKRRFHKTILPEEQCPPFTYMLFKGANG